jgi:hypothetical protein
MISQHISWHLHGWMALVGGARPGARPYTSFGLAIANVRGTCVQLNSDCLDPSHGLVAVAAERALYCCRFVVIEKSQLAAAIAAGCAVRIQLEIASLITMVLNSLIDCLYALTICALLRWS